MVDEPTVVTPSVTKDENKDGASERIQELIARNKELALKNDEISGKLDKIEEKINTIPVPAPPPIKEQTPQVKEAVDFLKKEGKFVDESDLDNKLKAINDRMILDSDHSKFEGAFNGADGRPKYERVAVEDYMRKNGIFNPQAAYEQMNKTELMDWEIKKYEKERGKKPFVAKPSSTADIAEDNTITKEKVAGWLKTAEGRLEYERHRKEVLQLMAEGKL